MKRKFKIILVLSLSLNILIVSGASLVIYKKGGISYLKSKIISSTENDSSSDNVKNQRESLFKLLPPISQKDIVFIGDSITQRCEWSELFDNPNIKNRGIDSSTSKDIINRLDKILAGKPNKIFIMVGVNDLQGGNSENEVLYNYKQLLSKIKKESVNTKVYIQSILPINASLNNQLKVTNLQITNINKKISKVASLYNDIFIDLNNKFANKKGQLKTDLTKDGVHLTGDGYILWKNLIEQYIKN